MFESKATILFDTCCLACRSVAYGRYQYERTKNSILLSEKKKLIFNEAYIILVSTQKMPLSLFSLEFNFVL